MKRSGQARLAGVYMILCQPTGERYIGASANLHQRERTHRSMLRGGHHLSRRLQLVFNRWGESAFEWVVLESVDAGPNLDDRLREAEFRHHTNSRKAHGHLLLSNPDATYQTKSRKGATAQQLLRQFKMACLAVGVNPRDELEKRLSAEVYRDLPAGRGRPRSQPPRRRKGGS